MEPLERELTPDERDALIGRIAAAVVDRRLETPAILALEMHRPLAFLGSQAAIVATPMVSPLVGLTRMQALVELMKNRENLDLLLDRIEELAAARDQVGDDDSARPAADGEPEAA